VKSGIAARIVASADQIRQLLAANCPNFAPIIHGSPCVDPASSGKIGILAKAVCHKIAARIYLALKSLP
jgi:hypothetical protein